MKPDTLLNLSGGIDSTFCMWQYLTTNNRPLLVHHINMKTREKRAGKEQEAIENILKWMETKGLTKYRYIESTHDTGTTGCFPFDIHIWGHFTGLILRQYSYIKKVIIPRHVDAFSSNWSAEDSNEVLTINAELLARRIPIWEYPIGDWTKKQIVQAIPRDLLNLTWWCRRPDGNNPCKKCQTCKQVFAALKEL